MIPEQTIARVRESIDLVELVRENVPGLRKTGRNFVARCPFHQEKTPSFNVNPELGLFKCFGCGVGGDAFKFVMLTESLSYPEAIRKLASRVGVAVEEDRPEALSGAARERETLYEVLDGAGRFYHRVLLESKEAAEARDYLRRRGLSDESLVRFSIGFAPVSGHALRDAATRKGWDVAILEKAGLLRRKETGRVYDHFWNRIIFPIWDVQGHLVAFGGRAMGDAMPKYINSPETPVYSKSRHLYGLFQGLATVRKRRHLVVLEGYMDVAVCHQFGFDFTAATLGTALTDEHVRLLRRYCDRVTLLFDPDAAGASATVRGGELLVAEGLTVDVVTLPDGLDPDEVLVRDGRDRLEAFLKEPMPFMDYFVAQVRQRHPGLGPEQKLAVAKDVLPLIRRMRDPILQEEYLGRLAEQIRVERSVLASQMRRLKTGDLAAPAAPASAASVTNTSRQGMLTIEEELLLLALLHPSAPLAAELDGLEWRQDRCREAWAALRTPVASGALHLSEVLPSLAEPTQQWLTALALQERICARPEMVLQELVQAWRRQGDTQEMQGLKQEIDQMIDGQLPMDARKVQAYHDLSRRLKGSRTSREAPFHG